MPSDKIERFEEEISDLGFIPVINEQKDCNDDTYAGYMIYFRYEGKEEAGEEDYELAVPVYIEFFYDGSDADFYRALDASMNVNLNKILFDVSVEACKQNWKILDYGKLKQEILPFVTYYIYDSMQIIADEIFLSY